MAYLALLAALGLKNLFDWSLVDFLHASLDVSHHFLGQLHALDAMFGILVRKPLWRVIVVEGIPDSTQVNQEYLYE